MKVKADYSRVNNEMRGSVQPASGDYSRVNNPGSVPVGTRVSRVKRSGLRHPGRVRLTRETRAPDPAWPGNEGG